MARATEPHTHLHEREGPFTASSLLEHYTALVLSARPGGRWGAASDLKVPSCLVFHGCKQRNNRTVILRDHFIDVSF